MSLKIKDYKIKYTIIFALTAILTYLYFIINSKSFVWHVDGYDQHVIALSYYGQWLRQIVRSIFIEHTFTFPMWNFTIGYGGDVLTTFNYYVIGDPLNLLSVAVPTKYTEFLYAFLVLVRMYLAGLFFMYYTRERGVRGNGKVVGAIIYVFCVYAMHSGVRHPFFILPMIFLPLVLAGLEKILKGKKPYLFIVSIAICVISNFYFFYMVAIITIVYALVRVIYLYRNEKPKIFTTLLKLLGFSLVGVSIACILFIPTVLIFIQDSRTIEGGMVPIVYEFKYYQKLLSGMISNDSSGHWNYIGVSPIALVGAYYAFHKRDVQKIILFVISILIMLIPFLGSFMNGMSYACNRWIWAYVFLCAYTVAYYWKDIISIRVFTHKKLTGFLMIYFVLILIMRNTRKESVIFQILLFSVMLFLLSFINNHKTKWFKYKIKIIFVFVVAGIALNAFYIFSVSEGNYVSEFIDMGEVYPSYESTVSNDIKKHIDDKSFYRFASTDDEYLNNKDMNMKVNEVLKNSIYSDISTKYFKLDNASNAATIFNRNGIGYYWSLGNINIQNYLSEIDNKEYGLFYYYGNDQRTILSSLSSVKYFVAEEGEIAKVPYGFKTIDTFYKYAPNMLRNKKINEKTRIKNSADYYIYENQYAMPLGYTYENTVTEKQASKLDGVKKEELMLESAIIEKEDELARPDEFKSSDKKLNYTVDTEDKNYVKISKNQIVVNRGQSKIDLTFDCKPNKNLFVYFKNFTFDQISEMDANKNMYDTLSVGEKNIISNKYRYYTQDDYARIYVNCGDVNKLLLNYRDDKSYFNNRTNFAINMCYSEAERTKATITFEQPGTYRFDDIEVVEQSFDGFEDKVNALRKNSLENVKINTNKITGNITLDKEKLLCLNIPYSDGWKLKVDGKETSLKKVNYMNSGVVLKAGKHKIELTYCTPGVMIGLIFTIAGILILLIIIIVYKVSRKNA
ncbi:MAG: YfhO family protein [Eubacterium sp.]|nr:YfhO family protein [Eubacterium sp.]